MISPRWKKVLQDLFSNQTRTLLTMLSIAVGVFAVGMNTTMAGIVLPDMEADYNSANAFGAQIMCAPFDDTLLLSIRDVVGVSGAEGRSSAAGQIVLKSDQKVPITFTGLPPIKDMKISLLKFSEPVSNLAKKEVWLDRSAAPLGLISGDWITIELPDGKIRQLLFKGYLHDVTIIPYGFTGEVPAYVTPDTIEWLGGTTLYTHLLITVKDNQKDKTHVSNIANAVSEKLKKGGITVYNTFVFNPGRHFSTDIFLGVMVILNILGWFTVFLSAFLVINTINALMTQHIKQIGIMKSIGGSSSQIVSMYLTLVLAFGSMSYLLAAPLASLLGYQVSSFMSNFVNFDLRPFRVIPDALLLQALIAFVIPTAAALVPVLGGVRMTVREALSNYGVGQAQFGANQIDHLLEKVRFLSRPQLISLRNTIRRKGRLLLTLSTLTLGGAIFISVFNLWAAFGITMRQVEGYFLADVNITLTRSYRSEKVRDLVMNIPGVTNFEGWQSASGQVLSDDKKSEVEIMFYAPPSDSTLIMPILTAGRWLVAGDENAVVIGNHLIKERPDIKVGDRVIIKVKEKEILFNVVGIYQMAGNTTPPILYTNPDYLGKINNTPNQIFEARLITAKHDLETQRQVAQAVQELFKAEKMPVSYVRMGVQWRQQQQSQTDVMIYFLLVMAILIAIVGGLGLMGTMAMNVMERIREIGVMRAVGATNTDIQQIVIGEGVLIGFVSWILGLILSLPITYALNYGVGISMFTIPLSFTFGTQGLFGWLVGVVFLATLASALPAWNASRLTIREVLAYE